MLLFLTDPPGLADVLSSFHVICYHDLADRVVLDIVFLSQSLDAHFMNQVVVQYIQPGLIADLVVAFLNPLFLLCNSFRINISRYADDLRLMRHLVHSFKFYL